MLGRCTGLPADARDPVRARLPAVRERLANALALIDPRSEFDQILDARIPELMQIEEVLQRFDLDVTIPDAPEHRGKRYMFVVQAGLEGRDIPVEVYGRIYVTVDK